MTRRTLAGILAVPLLIALWVVAALVPLPYVTYTPGITVDVLGESADGEIIEVSGHDAYRDGGGLLMTTVYVTQPEGRVNIFDAMSAWFRSDQAVYPRDSVYGPDETRESNKMQSAVQMVSSQDAAVAVALKALDYDVEEVVEVLNVQDDMPAQGKLEVRDVIVEVGGTPVSSPTDVVDAVNAQAEEGEPLTFVVERSGKRRTVEVTPVAVPADGGEPGETALRVGIVPGMGFTFPIEVKVNIEDYIGGPSAGLMFSLAIYDTLTPGSLTGGRIVAGSGTIDQDGAVGPIGGIQQKIAAAARDDASLFLVPADNCSDALGAAADGVTLVRVDTMEGATEAIEEWVADPKAELPSCETGDA